MKIQQFVIYLFFSSIEMITTTIFLYITGDVSFLMLKLKKIKITSHLYTKGFQSLQKLGCCTHSSPTNSLTLVCPTLSQSSGYKYNQMAHHSHSHPFHSLGL